MIAVVLERLRRALGWPGALGIALVLAAAIAYAAALRPALERLAALEAQIAEQASEARAPAPAAGGEAPQNQLEHFYRHFERPDTRFTDWLARLHVLGEEIGVRPRSVDYRYTALSDSRLVGHEMSLPLTGNYAQIRAFAESALASFPDMSLDQLRLTRKRIGDAQMEAELKITFYRPGP